MDNDVSIRDFLLDGLQVDGGHHKQWFLEELFRRFFGDDDFQACKKDIDWEPGIAP